MQTFTILPPGSVGNTPKMSNIREKLMSMHRSVKTVALTGGGFGPGDVENLSEELGRVVSALPANEGTAPRLSVNETIALAFEDIVRAQEALESAKKGLRASLDQDEADPGGIAARGISSALTLCIRAQSAMGAARIARS